MYNSGAWCVGVLLNDGECDDLGSVHKDLQIALSDVREYIDEVKFGEKLEKPKRLD